MIKSKPWHVYILRCGDGTLYTGIALDLDQRLETHGSGKGSRYVRSKKTFRLVYQERLAGRSAASKREAEIKKMTRRQKLSLIAHKGKA